MGDAPAGHRYDAVLFDLDGTLVDTAPDMVAALVRLQRQQGDAAIAYELARCNVSNGAAALIRLAFPQLADAERETLHRRYLAIYAQGVCRRSVLFPGVDELLLRLERHRRPWGVVTNKPQRLTDALLDGLGLGRRPGCAIGGDALPRRKPDPAPLLLASRRLGVAPARTVYVGDAARDIEAGRAAGMGTVAAGWGYITADDDPARWQADAVAGTPAELARILAPAARLCD